MGSCQSNKNSKNNDYHGGIQQSVSTVPSTDNGNLTKLKRTKSLSTYDKGISASKKKRLSINETLIRFRAKSTKKVLEDPWKILFEEWQKDAIGIGKK